MKKVLLFICCVFSLGVNAQSISLSNATASSLTFKVYAYGTNTGYNSCASLIYTDVTVPSNTLATIWDFTTDVWRDGDGNVVSASVYGSPVWIKTQISINCSGTTQKRIIGNGCGTTTSLVSFCSINCSWADSGGTVTVSAN